MRIFCSDYAGFLITSLYHSVYYAKLSGVRIFSFGVCRYIRNPYITLGILTAYFPVYCRYAGFVYCRIFSFDMRLVCVYVIARTPYTTALLRIYDNMRVSAFFRILDDFTRWWTRSIFEDWYKYSVYLYNFLNNKVPPSPSLPQIQQEFEIRWNNKINNTNCDKGNTLLFLASQWLKDSSKFHII